MTYIATVGKGAYNHTFGGATWTISSPARGTPAPALLLTLDLRAPLLGGSHDEGVVPLCSRVDVVSLARQRYRFDARTGTVQFLGEPWESELDPEDLPSTPFPEVPLRLRPAMGRETLASPGCDAQDTFLGEDSFVRVGGEPLWVDEPERARCACGVAMDYVACVGYEGEAGRLGGDEPFFLGELALYFFRCRRCAIVEVIAQAT